MKLSIIVACAKRGVIGKNNELPWHLSEDLKHFKEVTMGKPLIMGRKTFDSIGRPLPGRTTLVVTRQADWQCEGVVVCASIEDAVARAGDYLTDSQQEVFIAGGGEIYRQALPRVTRVYLTEVDLDIDGDAFFPELDAKQWRRVSEKPGYSENAGLHYRFVTLERIKPSV